MNNIVEKIKHFRLVFLLIGMGFLVMLVLSSPVEADLGGSNMEFAPAEGGAACFIPDSGLDFQHLFFTAQTTTTDGQDVAALFLKLPSDWALMSVTPVSTSCSNGGSHSYGGFSSTVGGSYIIDETRTQNDTEICTVVYDFEIRTGATTLTDANMSWAWVSNDNTKSPPLYPCSNDGYDPLGICDEVINPPATIPICEHIDLNILPETIPAAEVGSYYNTQLSVEGDYGPYSWSSSGLPANMFLYSNTGRLDGTPTTAGTYNVTVNVKGAGYSDGTRNYTFPVYPTLTFNPTGLPTARLTQYYEQSITLTGGTETYALSHTSGTLPEGITFLDGTFSGTPTETGTFEDIVITANYGAGLIKTKTYTLKVLPEHLFSWSPEEPLENTSATFSAISGYSNYFWTYGDKPGEPCSVQSYYYSQNAEIYFGLGGEYQVCLSFYDPYMNAITDNQWVTVNNAAPNVHVAWFEPEPSLVGLEVSGYIDIYDPDPAPFASKVNWGDGTDDEMFSCETHFCHLPTHVYNAPGNYDVQIWVTDNEGATGTATETHEVVYVAIENDYQEVLASNTHPTTFELTGLTVEGHTPLNFVIDAPPIHGSLGTPSLSVCEHSDWYDGLYVCTANVVFTPETGELYTGWDRFTYSVNDGMGNSDAPGVIEFWVDSNTTPVALDSSAVVSYNQPSTIVLTATDADFNNWIYDELSFIIDTLPVNGTLGTPEILFCSEHYDDWGAHLGKICKAVVLYTPESGTMANTDSLTFHVNDTHQDSPVATVSVELHTPTTLHVNDPDDIVDENSCDETHCTLREAVNDAKIGDTIDFTMDLPETIVLDGHEILVDKNVIINGPGADQLAVSGAETSRVFTIDSEGAPVTVTISGLTVRDGYEIAGGGVAVSDNNTLAMNDCVIGPNNIVEYAGGGIFNEGGHLTLNRCTVTENEGTGSLGGAGVTTAYGEATTTLINSTVSGNITNNYGGGIFVGNDCLVKLIHTTITGNISNADFAEPDEERGGGAGIYIDPYSDGQLEVQNSIIAGNIDLTVPEDAGHDKWPDVYGAVTSLGGNLIGDNMGSSGWDESDLVGTAADPVDPGLDSVLALNIPGSTPTHALLQGSLAMDAVQCLADVSVDQRGIPRPQGYFCDIGAYEFEQDPVFWDVFLPFIIVGRID